MDIMLDRWETMSANDCEAIAKRLVMDLPMGFSFDSVNLFRQGERQHHVALFRFDSAKFALIPGKTVILGFDSERLWKPTQEELESWQKTAIEYGIQKSIHEYIVEVTLRPRQAALSPFLIETDANELGWERIGLDDREVQDIFRECGQERRVEVSKGGVSTRVRKGKDGSAVAERSIAQTHADLADRLQSSGFRFPTSDEWEYACGCGEPTLFRWGDHAPIDHYPTDISPNKAAWRRQWMLSAGNLEYPLEEFAPDLDYHRQPNAFGIKIAFDPYKCELVAEIAITRGGDGGGMICGGAGFFIGWLTLATSYFEEHSCCYDPDEPILPGNTVGRRVLSLR